MLSMQKPLSAAPRRGEFVTRRLNGGLNYGFTYGLTASELRDGGDFDISIDGSIGSRRALKPFTTENLAQGVLNSWAWQDNAGHDHMFAVLASNEIVVATDGAVSFSASVFGTMTDSDSVCVPHAWSAGGWLYVSDGFRVWRWGGIGFGTYDVRTSVLVHPESTTPEATNLGVPPNQTAETYRDTVFIGNTLVYMTDPDAVWWSWPVSEQPTGSALAGLLTGQEDYFENQRITFISGQQADKITKLIAAGPTLYAFKRHSVHVLSTNGSEVLSNDLSTEVGLAGTHAVAAQNGDIWFFDEHQGLHAISGNALPQQIFDPIWPLLDCGRITHPELIAIGIDNNRVFVSCCLDSTDEVASNNTTFVLNTDITASSKGGAWSKWDVGFSCFTKWQPESGDSSLVGFTTGAGGTPQGAVRLNECSTSITDDYGFTTRPIAPWFRTAFFDDALPSLRKRWERLALTVVSNGETKLGVIATVGPTPRRGVVCDQPANVQPSLPDRGTGTVDIDLTPYLCTVGAGTQVCDTDSNGIIRQDGAMLCGDEIGDGSVSARVARIAFPGRGVAFALEVRDAGSEKAWTIDELDAKYQAVVEFS